MDLKTWLPNDILVRWPHGHGQLTRGASPLLDHKVIEFAAGLPPDLKYRDGTSKYLLKRYAERGVPSSVIHRPKMGFSIPLAAWLRGALRDTGQDLLLSDRALGRGYFMPDRVRTMWSRHQSGVRDHSHHLWALMMLEPGTGVVIRCRAVPPESPDEVLHSWTTRCRC